MNSIRAIGLKILSVFFFMAMAVCIKAAAPRIPAGEMVFFRSFFAIPVILAWLAWQGDFAKGLKTNNPMGHLWRGLAGVTGMGLGFTALGLLPLPEVTALGYTAPLLTVLFAAVILGEKVRIFRLTAVGVGLVGVIIILTPRLTALSGGLADAAATLGIITILTGAVFRALAVVFVRKLVRTEATAAIVFYFSLTASVLALVTIPFGWVLPSPKDFALLVAAGLFGGLGQIPLTASYRLAPISVIAPFEYTSMLLSLVAGFFLFAEVPTLVTISGAALIVAAGIFIIWREHRLGLERSQSRKVMTPQG